MIRGSLSAGLIAALAISLAGCAAYPGPRVPGVGASVRLGLSVAPSAGYAVKTVQTPFSGYTAKDVTRIVLTVYTVTDSTAVPVQVPSETAGQLKDLTSVLVNGGSDFAGASVTFSQLAPDETYRIEAVAWGVDPDGQPIQIQADDGTCHVEVSTHEATPGQYEQAITTDVDGHALVIPVTLRDREFSGRAKSPNGVTILPGARTSVDFTPTPS